MTAPSSLSLLRRLGWLRWRVIRNGILRSGNRDFMERLSRAAESALPLAILVLAIPAAIALCGFGMLTGWYLARDASSTLPLLQGVRFMLLAVTVLAIFAPVILSAAQQASGIVRLLLLPIPLHVLYIAQALGALADPWVLLSMPLMLGVVVGLAAQAQGLAALTSAVAALAMTAVLLGVSALSTACLQLLVRNRRRAEAVTLFGTLLLIALSLIPAALAPEHAERTASGRAGSGPQWMSVVSAAAPSELYGRAIEAAARGVAASSGAVLALFAWAAFAHGLAWPLYRRLLVAPSSTGGIARYPGRSSPRSIPLIGRRASAVAVNFVRLAFRTPRGRAIVLAPVVMMAVFAVLFTVRGQTVPVGPVRIGGGFTLAAFGAVVAVLSLGPLLFNQFAVDGTGLTLTFLAPVGDREILRGKAAGGFLIAIGPILIGFVAGMLTGAHAVPRWIALALGVIAVYVVYAPIAALLGMVLPRTVDLSTIGNASNAHQGAAILGLLGFATAAAPPALLAAAAERAWGDDRAVALAVAGWLVPAAVISFSLFRIAERVLSHRRENLAMVAHGR